MGKIKKIILFLIVFAISISFISCFPSGSRYKGTGKISDVQRFLNGQTGDKVIEIELIYTFHVDEWTWDNRVSFDGMVFWEGITKLIPAHDILFFRGYSQKLESYIFVQFNDSEDTKSYYTLSTYNPDKIEKEKNDVEQLIINTKEVLLEKDIEVLNIYYKQYNEEENLDNIYKQSKDLFEEYFLANGYPLSFTQPNQLWIMIEIADIEIETYEDRQKFGYSFAGIFDDIENYRISIAMRSANSIEFVFYKGSFD